MKSNGGKTRRGCSPNRRGKTMTHHILILPGDGIGPEIVAEAAKVLECLRQECGLDATLDYGLLGGCAVDALGAPYPEETRRQAQAADAILLGAVGGPEVGSAGAALAPGTRPVGDPR
jgi:3-isopropylmalate dehydrogenase